MSPSFKGIISIIVSVLFFFPWVWMRIFQFNTTTVLALTIGLIAAIVAAVLGFQARKGGSKVLGIAGLTLGAVSVVLHVVNIIAFIGRA